MPVVDRDDEQETSLHNVSNRAALACAIVGIGHLHGEASQRIDGAQTEQRSAARDELTGEVDAEQFPSSAAHAVVPSSILAV